MTPIKFLQFIIKVGVIVGMIIWFMIGIKQMIDKGRPTKKQDEIKIDYDFKIK